jgi:predicted dehydrogenase
MTLTVGILGFAHAHVNTYCTQWRRHPDWGVSVAAGWDHDAARLAKAAQDHGIDPRASAAELVDDPHVQAVVIGAETSMHAGLVEQAAAAGKAIVLQKPAALTMGEADRIVEAVNRHRVPFTLAWQMRVDPQNLLMKQMVGRGDLGRIYMIRRRHGLPTQSWPWISTSWHADVKLNRGMWADDACHAIDFLLWLMGKPDTVAAEIATLRDPKVPDDNGVAVYRYDNGPLAEIACSFTCVAAENTTEIIGEQGSIVQNLGDVPSCNTPRLAGQTALKWFTTATGQWTVSDIAAPAGHGERIAGLAQPLAEFLAGRRPPIATAEEGRTALQMTLACYESARTGRRVRIADIV